MEEQRRRLQRRWLLLTGERRCLHLLREKDVKMEDQIRQQRQQTLCSAAVNGAPCTRRRLEDVFDSARARARHPVSAGNYQNRIKETRAIAQAALLSPLASILMLLELQKSSVFMLSFSFPVHVEIQEAP